MSNPFVELWTAGVGLPNSTVRQARQAEDEGWDGLGVVDSQNLSGDPYVALALAAGVTSRLGLATGVTNPFTLVRLCCVKRRSRSLFEIISLACIP